MASSSSLCKITAAMEACIFILALVLPSCSKCVQNQQQKPDFDQVIAVWNKNICGGQRNGCSEVGRSKTFQGDCHSDGDCADACRSEGYTDGYCFTNVATPDPICMCVAQCPPATTTRKMSS
ncbi:hypothetical protein ABZP36_022030 [Zizania latifolia]